MDQEKSRLIKSMYFPLVFVGTLWLVKLVEEFYGMSFVKLGIHPMHIDGLIGLVTGTFIHSDFGHLFANSVPLLVLGGFTFYFYKEDAYKIFFMIMIVCNIWVWVLGRDSYHIGASGLVYGLAAYHALSGWLRRHLRLMALSFLVIFLYGGMVWGAFPDFFPQKNISWEAHMMGGVAGIVVAWFFRKSGPQREVYEWEDEDDEEDELTEDELIDNWLQENGKAKKVKIVYHPKKDK